MMVKLTIIIAIVLLAGGFLLVNMMKGSTFSEYDYLKEPQISTKKNLKVIEVTFDVPSSELAKPFGVLFKTYFKTKGTPKGFNVPPSIARYKNAIDMTMEPEKRKKAFAAITWKGFAALPIPASVTTLPTNTAVDGIVPKITTWTYGEVAEILHFGPYEEEPPTVKKLLTHIENQGYQISGLHEEEYLRGPGTPFAKPKDYITIIRYPVKKK